MYKSLRRSGEAKPITARGIDYLVWLILSLLLPTPTICTGFTRTLAKVDFEKSPRMDARMRKSSKASEEKKIGQSRGNLYRKRRPLFCHFALPSPAEPRHDWLILIFPSSIPWAYYSKPTYDSCSFYFHSVIRPIRTLLTIPSLV